MTTEQIQLLRETFVRVEEKSDIAALVFYRHVFEQAPELRALFSTSIELQGRKLMESLRQTVAALEKPDLLIPMLESLGRRHVAYGTKDEHYDIIVRSMLAMLREILGPHLSPPAEAAWSEALQFVSSVMKQGAARSRVP